MTEEQFGQLVADVKWIKENLERKADKWVEKYMSLFIIGTLAWALKMVVDAVETVKAFLL